VTTPAAGPVPRDAEAIAEAATRPTMRFVELKSEARLDRDCREIGGAEPEEVLSSPFSR
jgi:transposase